MTPALRTLIRRLYREAHKASVSADEYGRADMNFGACERDGQARAYRRAARLLAAHERGTSKGTR